MGIDYEQYLQSFKMRSEFTLTYNDIIRTVSAMVEDGRVQKQGLSLRYQVSEYNHEKLDESLYYRTNPTGRDFQHQDVIEINLGGIDVIITKKPEE